MMDFDDDVRAVFCTRDAERARGDGGEAWLPVLCVIAVTKGGC